MPLTRNLSLIFKAVPQGLPVPGTHLTIEDRPIDVNDVPVRGIITRNMYSSLDPYMRLMLIGPKTQHYRQSFTLGEPLRSLTVAEVIRSSRSDFPRGTLLRTSLPIQQYSVLSEHDVRSKIGVSNSAKIRILPSSKTSKIHPVCWLGPLGMPGLTAYSSLFEIGRPSAGETIFVSAAAGAVGQTVGQICKIQGLKVIGSAGSSDKCSLLTDELGFDATFNYKSESTLSALKRLAPEGIDIYFDNVGGQTLEDALACMRTDDRIIACGMVSQYNSTGSESTSAGAFGVKNLFQFVSKGLTMRGFQVSNRDFGPKYEAEFENAMAQWIEEGKFKPVISEVRGVKAGAEAFVAMLGGKHVGKAVLRLDSGSEKSSADETDADYHRIVI